MYIYLEKVLIVINWHKTEVAIGSKSVKTFNFFKTGTILISLSLSENESLN